MEIKRISHQYEPGFLHNIIELESDTEKTETPETPEEPTEPAPEEDSELIDFYITPAAVESLKVIVTCSKVLVVALVLFSLVEMTFFAFLFLSSFSSLLGILTILHSIASLCINGFLIFQSVKFIQKMGQAIRYNDNTALPEAFGHQAVYFKWAFVSVTVSLFFVGLQLS